MVCESLSGFSRVAGSSGAVGTRRVGRGAGAVPRTDGRSGIAHPRDTTSARARGSIRGDAGRLCRRRCERRWKNAASGSCTPTRPTRFARIGGRGKRGRRHADGQRQDAVLQPAGAAIGSRASPTRGRSTCFPPRRWPRTSCTSSRPMVEAMGSGIRAFTYDGDTPQDARKAIRERANVVLTNPDMLHTGILPHHTNWAKLFENLRYVVIDELHYYRGVFGSHLANVLRRLQADLRVLRIVAAVHLLLGDHRQSEGTGRGADRKRRVELVGRQRRARRARSTSSSTTRRWSTGSWASGAAICTRRAASRVGVHRARSADAGVRQHPAGDRGAADLPEGRLRRGARVGERPCAAIAAATCRASGARSSADCATATSAPWWRPTRSSWASTSARSTPS